MIERFVPQPYPLWAGLWEDDCNPIVCPVIGWQAPDPNDSEGYQDPGLTAVLAHGHHTMPAIPADVVEYFPTQDAAQSWVDNHPYWAEQDALIAAGDKRWRKSQTPSPQRPDRTED